ncbi:MAG: hypothetical protein CSA26_07990 [Desulfobacterales bacterium]|nr:MAG: hypothetical protein CSA26_07990 [Desulfobacterales bacterium]
MQLEPFLPTISGAELIAETKKFYPEIECMAFMVIGDRKTFFEVISAKATRYLFKRSPPRQIIEALHEIHDGDLRCRLK